MGLLGKGFASKLRTISKLAVSKIAILKNQHQARSSYARSDIVELLNLGYHERALLRVEHYIKAQNKLDVFVMIEHYCNFSRETAQLLEKNKDCPDELKEATSSLIFASSRCGELPELQKMREIFTSKFGKEFAVHAVELHRNSRVNTKMIQKLSAKQAALEIRLKVLKDIAIKIGVTLHLEKDSKLTNVNKLNVDQKQEEPESSKSESENDAKDRENKGKKSYHHLDLVAQALESADFGIEVNEHSSHRAGLESDLNRFKNNQSFDHNELEERETRTQLSKAESCVSQNPEDDLKKTPVNTELVSNKCMDEDRKRNGNMHNKPGSTESLPENIYESKRQSDIAAENEHFNEDRTQKAFFPKQVDKHEQMQWKFMSVRTR